jgi:uncharacterized protein YjiK
MIARSIGTLLLLAAAVVASSCKSREDAIAALMKNPEVTTRNARFDQLRAQGESAAGQDSGTAVARWMLPPALREVSGLALTADGRLLTHGDETGKIWEIDYRRGVLVKEFTVGNQASNIDFEGITLGKNSLFMIESTGNLYEFREGNDGEKVEYAVHETGLQNECEFEGVAYDPRIESLLLACKDIRNDALKNMVVIFRWSLSDSVPASARLSQLTVPVASLALSPDQKEMRPSDICVDPASGNYVLISSLDHALFEITPTGEVVYVRPLPREHEQPEGLTVTSDSLLIVADEALNTAAFITV